MRLPAILNTTAARLSALFLLLFMVCAIALVTYMTALSVRMLTGQTREAIDQEIAQLNQVYQIAGLPGLVRAVELVLSSDQQVVEPIATASMYQDWPSLFPHTVS